jgi:uncharacterized protein (DUF4213/DUF364 family)
MRILADLIDSLRGKDHPVKEVLTGAYWTSVVSRGCGLASTFRDEGHPHKKGVREIGQLTEKTALQLAQYALSDYPMEASIGMAAANSLIEIDERACVEKNAAEILLEKGEGKDMAVVGHFPFIPRLRERARHLWVFEQRPGEGDLRPEDVSRIFPRCEVIGITGTSFINHTLEELLRRCQGKFVLLIGPTTPMTPFLFDYGIHGLSGTMVVNPREAFRFISQGATYQEIRGVRRVTMLKD